MNCWIRRLAQVAGVVLALQQLVMADDALESRFEDANLLYEKGQFETAARAYEQLISEGYRSAPLLFNAGNANFKAGQTGRAVAFWLQAEALEPRNDRIKINLEFARKSIAGGVIPVPAWPAPLQILTLDEWAMALLVSGWLFFGALTVLVIRPSCRSLMRLPVTLCGLLLLCVVLLAVMTARDRLRTITAVVVTDEAVVRFGPLSESQSAFVARNGSEFRVTDRKDEWLKIEDSQGREGWLLGSQVIQLRAGRLLAAPAALPAPGDAPARIASVFHH